MEKYTVVKRVGEGSFGKVYLAHEKDTDPKEKPLVIKVLPLPRNDKERDSVVR